MAGGYQVLQDQINALGVGMDKGFLRLENLLASYELRMRTMENEEARCQPIITNRLEAANVRLMDHDKLFEAIRLEMALIEKNITELQASNRVLKWFAGVAGSAFVLWLVGSILNLI